LHADQGVCDHPRLHVVDGHSSPPRHVSRQRVGVALQNLALAREKSRARGHTGDGTRTLLRVVAIAAFAVFVLVAILIRRRSGAITASFKND
jgi:hypothetical protein